MRMRETSMCPVYEYLALFTLSVTYIGVLDIILSHFQGHTLVSRYAIRRYLPTLSPHTHAVF